MELRLGFRKLGSGKFSIRIACHGDPPTSSCPTPPHFP